MPELPEIQTIVTDLIAHGIAGARILGFKVIWRRSVSERSDRFLKRHLIGRRIKTLSRRGKYIVFHLDHDQQALLHLRMSGRLHIHRIRDPWGRHEHFGLRFEDGRELRLHDTRKFARFYVGPQTAVRLQRLGPEPLSPRFKLADLRDILHNKDRRLKPLLLDQSFLAGLGNIYVDETLWAARLHPLRKSAGLDAKDIGRLYRALRRILTQAVLNGGTSLGGGMNNFRSLSHRPGRHRAALRVYGRSGQPCPRCRTAIQRLVVTQRSTHVCPVCQPGPKN